MQKLTEGTKEVTFSQSEVKNICQGMRYKAAESFNDEVGLLLFKTAILLESMTFNAYSKVAELDEVVLSGFVAKRVSMDCYTFLLSSEVSFDGLNNFIGSYNDSITA